MPGDRQRGDQEGQVGDRHLLAQPAHVPDLVAVHGVDDRPGRKEQQRLEERVREQVEHAGRVAERIGHRRHAQGKHHVAQLAERGERQHALDVVLRDADDGGEVGRCYLGELII